MNRFSPSGIYTRVAKRCKVTTSYVSLVANGDRRSLIILKELLKEWRAVEKRWSKLLEASKD
jgi:hypothetical protein